MNSKEELEHLNELKKEIEAGRMLLKELKTATAWTPFKYSPSTGAVQKRDSGKMNELVAKYIVELDRQEKEYAELREKLIDKIQGLPDKLQQSILIGFYFNGTTWSELSKKYYYSRRQLGRICEEAFKEMDKETT